MTRTARVLAPALLALFVSAGVARADQLAWIPRRDAEKAAAALTPGSLFVDWISHMDGKPVIYKVVSAQVVAVDSPGLAEVKVKAIEVATGREQTEDGPWAFNTARSLGEAKDVSIDLAYCYVPSAELPGSFTCLGKRMKLECTVKSVAIEVGEETIAKLAALRSTSNGISGSIPGR